MSGLGDGMRTMSAEYPHPSISLEIDDLDPFEEWKRIGNGGFSVVYRTYCKKHGEVAVKKLTRGCYEKEMREEINHLIQTLTNQFIISIKGVVIDRPWIVMEFCHYGSLSDVRQKLPALEDSDAKRIFGRLWPRLLYMIWNMAMGLSFLHSEKIKIVHRDLKPQNVLVCDNFVAKIGDVGLSKIKGSASQADGAADCQEKEVLMPSGTPVYLSPELWKNPRKIEEESDDVYSFAVLLWKFITNWNIFYLECKNDSVTFKRLKKFVTKGQRPSDDLLEMKDVDVPDEVVEVIKSCWHVDTQNRLQFSKVAEIFRILVCSRKANLEEADSLLKELLHKKKKNPTTSMPTSPPANTSPPKSLVDPQDATVVDSVASVVAAQKVTESLGKKMEKLELNEMPSASSEITEGTLNIITVCENIFSRMNNLKGTFRIQFDSHHAYLYESGKIAFQWKLKHVAKYGCNTKDRRLFHIHIKCNDPGKSGTLILKTTDSTAFMKEYEQLLRGEGGTNSNSRNVQWKQKDFEKTANGKPVGTPFQKSEPAVLAKVEQRTKSEHDPPLYESVADRISIDPTSAHDRQPRLERSFHQGSPPPQRTAPQSQIHPLSGSSHPSYHHSSHPYPLPYPAPQLPGQYVPPGVIPSQIFNQSGGNFPISIGHVQNFYYNGQGDRGSSEQRQQAPPYQAQNLTKSQDKVTPDDILLVQAGISMVYNPLARRLGMEQKGQEIKMDFAAEGVKEQSYQLLSAWVDTYGCYATKTKLATALYDVGAYNEAMQLG